MPALVAAVGVVCASLAAVALAASSSPAAKPSVTLSAPAEVVSGAKFVVTGRIAPEASGRIAVQANRGRGWRTIVHARARHHRFKVDCALTGEGAVRLRATLGAGPGPPILSRARALRLRPPAPPPAPAAPSATPPSPAPTTQVAPPEPAPETPPSITGAYWGAWFDGNPAPEDIAALRRFEGLAGKPLSILEAFSPWATCSSGNACAPNQFFPAGVLERIRDYGAIPLYSWASEANGSAEEPAYQLADIIAGTYDGYIERWANEAKAWGHPFFLRFDWEMNGNFFPWGANINGNQAGEYATAWQHVHDIFTRVGATNVTWLWCPFANPGGNLPASTSFYPGDAYVDWTGIDGYNRGTTSPKSRWRTFTEVFAPDYAAITALAPSKPMLLPEVASAERGAPAGSSKAAWIGEMFAQLPTAFPAVRGFLWFDLEENDPEGRPHEWPIETSVPATEAFAAGVADPRYLSNSFGTLPDGPVPVPTG